VERWSRVRYEEFSLERTDRTTCGGKRSEGCVSIIASGASDGSEEFRSSGGPSDVRWAFHQRFASEVLAEYLAQ
jgi:hypothetical protein